MNGCLFMQILKDEIRNLIHQAALIEFREKGFQNASMRSIAERGGMTVGNLYRYFKNKEDLFYAVISPAYHKIIALTQERFIKMDDWKEDATFMEYIVDRIMAIHREHRSELLILIEGCEGTKFEHAKEEFIALLENRFKNHLFRKLAKRGVVIEDAFFAHAIAVSQIEGMKTIIKHYEDEGKMRRLIQQFIQYHFKGILERFV